jgi:hypothetical protein
MTTKTLSENVADLPKWAQSEIRVLQMRLKEAKDELHRIKENPETNTLLDHPHSLQGHEKQYLKDNQRVYFLLEKGYIQAGIEQGYLNIHTSGEGELNIRPHVSNAIQLHLK